MKSFSEQFRDNCNKIKEELNKPKIETTIIKFPGKVETKPNKVVPNVLYNIHKRSLPIGEDKPVVFNLNERDADNWIKQKLKPKLIENQITGKKKAYYYDKVRQDGHKSGLFDNDVPLIKEKGTIEESLSHSGIEYEIKWED
jgi:hypothetical protein